MTILRRFFWPYNRWHRIRNIAATIWLLGGGLIHIIPEGPAKRSVAMIVLVSTTIAIVYGYESWRRDRPHTDTYDSSTGKLLHCNDHEYHEFHLEFKP